MKLSTYLDQGGPGAAARLARSIGVSPVLISQWRSEHAPRPVPVKRCPSIERETGGLVRCEDLRPDVDWGYLRTFADFKEL